MSSKGKSDVTAHTHARVEAQVSQDKEPATGKQRRQKKAKNDRGKEVGVFQGVGEVEDQDQQARSNENEERLPSGSPMGECDAHTHTHLRPRLLLLEAPQELKEAQEAHHPRC